MVVAGALSVGIGGGVISEKSVVRRGLGARNLIRNVNVTRVDIRSRRLRFDNVVRGCGLISDHEGLDYETGGSKLDYGSVNESMYVFIGYCVLVCFR